VVARIGPMRNKMADQSGSTGETSDARRERRRARA
jgi:5-methyltetrahydrofolate--homocysteine methyltransferase